MDITLSIGDVELAGDLAVPTDAVGLVLFAHGSGSSRSSPRNQHVARTLQGRGLATLLFDLLTRDEERRDAIDAHLRFDVDLLAGRLVGATDWARTQASVAILPIGYFGASTGAAAALIAAARRPEVVAAVVSRGGRPDLAAEWIPRVRAPTLLVVGGEDREVLSLNRVARARLTASSELLVIPGATHLFEEPGALDQVARAAAEWLVVHLSRISPGTRRGLGDSTC